MLFDETRRRERETDIFHFRFRSSRDVTPARRSLHTNTHSLSISPSYQTTTNNILRRITYRELKRTSLCLVYVIKQPPCSTHAYTTYNTGYQESYPVSSSPENNLIQVHLNRQTNNVTVSNLMYTTNNISSLWWYIE